LHENISHLIALAGVALVAGFFAITLWTVLTGATGLNYLLYGCRLKERSGSSNLFFSPGRAQLLFVTSLVTAYYLFQILTDPSRFPEIPTAWFVALGLSHSVYLGGKARSMLFGNSTHRR
jgi:hypothetical protein